MSRRAADQLDPEQEQLLKEAKRLVQSQAFQMKRALDHNPPHVLDAFNFASNLISELRTSLLSPRAYHELYLLCCDELRHLEQFLSDSTSHGKSLTELYEYVQYAGNILPRLYILVTVGAVYIKLREAPANEVLHDLVELCRGVQHPVRGLFLRSYLSDVTKDLLPDDGSTFAGEVTESIDFILANFTEMNKLWVRLQHGAGPIRTPQQRERERQELSLLVGKNLQRLARLEGLTIGIYRSDVLPRVLTQITQCRDRLAQQYLMEIVIQVFSDEFHIRTLDILLDSSLILVDDVDVARIIASLIDRLARFCEADAQARQGPPQLPEGIDLFEKFTSFADKMSLQRKSSDVSGLISLDNALLQLALKVYQGEAAKLDAVFASAYNLLEANPLEERDRSGVTAVLNLLKAPIAHYKNPRHVLTLPSYGKVLTKLPGAVHKRFATEFIDSFLQNEIVVPTAAEAVALLTYASPLVVANPVADQNLEDLDIREDQQTVAYIISMFKSPQDEEHLAILTRVHEILKTGGGRRIVYTYPTLLFKALKFVQKLYSPDASQEDASLFEKKAKRIFKFVNDLLTELRDTGDYTLIFRLYLQCALCAGRVQLPNFAYGFLTKGAISLSEEDVMAKSKLEYENVRLLISTVRAMNCFNSENYEYLATRLTQHAGTIDGGSTKFQSGEKVQQCLKKLMTVAGNIHDADVMIELLVELLDRFLYFYARMPGAIDVVYINSMIKKIHKHFTVASLPPTNPAVAHFARVQAFIATQEWRKAIEYA